MVLTTEKLIIHVVKSKISEVHGHGHASAWTVLYKSI
jgi:hypothetical protein